MVTMLDKLIHSRQFWLAVAAAVWNILFYIWPNFPPEIRDSINVIIIALITALTVEDAARAVASAIAPTSLEALVLPEKVSWLLSSRKFWLAVLAALQTILLSSLPDFPPEIWQSINMVILVVIGALTIDDTTEHVASAWKRK